MNEDFKNLDRIHPEVRQSVVEFCERLMKSIATGIKAIAIYGSATGPDYIVGRSNVNISVLVDRIDHEVLRSLLETVKWGLKKRIVPPLLLTEGYIKASLDVFPIEFAEMKDSAVIIYGDDFLASLEIAPEHMRLECESQLKGALLRTRQAYLEIGLAKKGAERVLHASLTSLIPVMKAMLRLKGLEPPRRKIEVVKLTAETFNINGSVFIEILQDRAGDEKIADKEAHFVLGRYTDQLEVLAEKIEQL